MPMFQIVCPPFLSELVAACSTKRKSDTGKSSEVGHVVSLFKDRAGRKQLLNLERERAQDYADILDEVRYSAKLAPS